MTDQPTRQFVAVEFKPGGPRYTYHHDGPPIAVGERVKVPAFRGDGWTAVTVAAVDVAPPKFPTKAVLGLCEPPPAPAGQLDLGAPAHG